jgi:putative transposase
MTIDTKLIDELLTDYKKPEDIIGENGLLKELIKAILERALAAQLTDHLGYKLPRLYWDPKSELRSVRRSQGL